MGSSGRTQQMAIPFQGVGSSSAWTSMPSGLTEYRGTTVLRTKVNLANFSEIRLVARVVTAGATGAVIGVGYSTDESTWVSLSTTATIDTAAGTKDSGWVSLPAGAKADVFLRIYGQGGDGATSPAFGTITAWVR